MSSNYWQQKLGPVYHNSSDTLEQSISKISEMLKAQPDLEYEANYWYGFFHLTNGQSRNAEKYYLRALELSDDPYFKAMIFEQLAIVESLDENCNIDLYFDHLFKSIELNSENEERFMGLVDEYLEYEEYEKAEKLLTRFSTFNPKNPDIHRYLGKLYEHTYRDEEAEAEYLTALSWPHECPDIYQGLGRLYFKKRAFAQSREMFIKANIPNCISEYNYYGIAINYQEENDEYRALEYYHEALKLNPDYFDVHNNLGKLYFELFGDYRKAKEHLDKAEQLASDTTDKQLVYMNLARLHKVIVDTQTSAEYTVKLLKELGFPAELREEDDDE